MEKKKNFAFFPYLPGIFLTGMILLFSGDVRSQARYQKSKTAIDIRKQSAEKRHATSLNVLFLGDEGSHRPANRLKLVIEQFSRKGINIFYSDRQEDLNLEKLRSYDVLMFYGARANLTREQETALYRYVNEGGGIVAIHSGGGLFKESDAYVSLIGGAFKSHGVGTFKTKDIRSDHPVMKGVPNFESWDETYVHMKHNPDKTVLSLRVDGSHEEPWTWVRNQGNGRVFYTAWGHDYKTWTNTGFQKLIENAMRWCAGDWALTADFHLPPTENEKKKITISNKYIVVEPVFESALFASEPDVVKPIDFTWDESGRLWLLESVDYPNGTGKNRIKILEDANRDGKVDKVIVFAEGLNMSSGLVLYNRGAIVIQAPDVLYLKDTNGDNKADSKKVLFTGWGRKDSHQVASNLQYGFDNQIWGTVGGSGFEGNAGSENHKFAHAIYRFKPDGSRLELMSRTSNNPCGLGFNEEGSAFASIANVPAVHSIIPERFYDKTDQASSQDSSSRHELSTIANSNRVFPIKPGQNDYPNTYISAAGFQIYTARDFPEEYWNRIAFVSEPAGHILTKLILEPEGSTYKAQLARNVMASTDEGFAPVQSKVGPDGALWVIDQHNGSVMSNGQSTSEAKNYGRIYRVVYKQAARKQAYTLKDASLSKLINTLRHDNLFWRLTAQRLLVERRAKDILPQLFQIIQDKSIDKSGLNPAALHAIWTLHGLGVLNGDNQEALNVVLNALYHPSASVRRAALMTLPRTQQSLDKIIAADYLPNIDAPLPGTTYTLPGNFRMLSDSKGLVATLLAVAEMPSSVKAGQAVAELVVMHQKIRDRAIREALVAAAIQNSKAFLERVFSKKLSPNAESQERVNIQTVIQKVSMEYARNKGFSIIKEHLISLSKVDTAIGIGFTNGIVDAWSLDKNFRPGNTDLEQLKEIIKTLPVIYQDSLNKLLIKWAAS